MLASLFTTAALLLYGASAQSSAASSVVSSIAAAPSSSAVFSGSPGQATANSFVNPAVPTGTPIPGNYTGGLRPQIHFSPPQHFMNDPNGMFKDAQGIWHLYYQYNPTGDRAGNQHWGHATSTDLYHWENQQIAIFPNTNQSYIFSGSCVIDVNNTSGFFPNQTNGVVAFYTEAIYYPTAAGPQTQYVAYSTDGGYTFTNYEGNPVLSAPDASSSQFRDPKVIRYNDHWVMVVAFAQEFVIGFYTSRNLVDWTFASNFSHHGLLGLQYECPNLVEVPVRGSSEYDSLYVLQISINPGAPLGGSIEEYFPGTFNGTHFTPIDNAARIADFGKDRYAGQFFYNTPGQAVSISWGSNWQYCQDVPTGNLEGWRSSMMLPRINYLAQDYRQSWLLYNEFYNLSGLYDTVVAQNSSGGNGTIVADFSTLYSQTIYFEANFTGLGTNPQGTVNVTFSSPISGEYVRGGFYFGGDAPFFYDRGGIRGFSENPFFTDKFSTSTPVNPRTGNWSMSGVFDRTTLEFILDGGARQGSNTFFPEQPLTIMTMSIGGLPVNASVSYVVRGLSSAWLAQASEDGTVYGNVTSSSNSTSSSVSATTRATGSATLSTSSQSVTPSG